MAPQYITRDERRDAQSSDLMHNALIIVSSCRRWEKDPRTLYPWGEEELQAIDSAENWLDGQQDWLDAMYSDATQSDAWETESREAEVGRLIYRVSYHRAKQTGPRPLEANRMLIEQIDDQFGVRYTSWDITRGRRWLEMNGLIFDVQVGDHEWDEKQPRPAMKATTYLLVPEGTKYTLSPAKTTQSVYVVKQPPPPSPPSVSEPGSDAGQPGRVTSHMIFFPDVPDTESDYDRLMASLERNRRKQDTLDHLGAMRRDWTIVEPVSGSVRDHGGTGRGGADARRA